MRSVEKCATSWQLSLQSQNKSPRTIETYLAAVKQFNGFLDERGLPTIAAKIEREHVEAYMSWLLSVWSEGTASVRYRALQQFFKWLVEESELDESPMTKTKAPTVHEKPPKILDDADVTALMRTCSGTAFDERRDTAILYLLDDSGMRRSELCGLKVDDVSLSERVAYVIGKGGRPRVCSFGADAALALDRYLRLRDEHPYADSSAFWLGRSGPLTGNGLAQMLRRRGRQADVPNVHAHRFRHTMAHEWKMAGGNESALMAHAGWTSRSMLDRYGKSAAQALAKVEFQRVRGGTGRRVGGRR